MMFPEEGERRGDEVKENGVRSRVVLRHGKGLMLPKWRHSVAGGGERGVGRGWS